ncbi:MAG: aquaporin [Mollicutes bacterium PWAP]|nr:aquaporin [Mollicutes bacterium PWAP]
MLLSLGKKNREDVVEPKNKLTWFKHGISEFIGTILIALGLAGLSISVTSSGEEIEHFFYAKFLVGIYAGFVVVGILLVVFLRWSCDLNPAVSMYRWITGKNTTKYFTYKIIIQFVAGILVGIIIYFAGHGNSSSIANHAINAHKAGSSLMAKTHLTTKGLITVGSILIFVVELIMMMVLMWPIFTGVNLGKYRDIIICFIIALDVYMGMVTGSAAINPARGLSQQIPGLLWGANQGGIGIDLTNGALAANHTDLGNGFHSTMSQSDATSSLVSATVSMELGTLLAPVALVGLQEFTSRIFNKWFTSSIEYKNHRAESMIFSKYPNRSVVQDIQSGVALTRREKRRRLSSKSQNTSADLNIYNATIQGIVDKYNIIKSDLRKKYDNLYVKEKAKFLKENLSKSYRETKIYKINSKNYKLDLRIINANQYEDIKNYKENNSNSEVNKDESKYKELVDLANKNFLMEENKIQHFYNETIKNIRVKHPKWNTAKVYHSFAAEKALDKRNVDFLNVYNSRISKIEDAKWEAFDHIKKTSK